MAKLELKKDHKLLSVAEQCRTIGECLIQRFELRTIQLSMSSSLKDW